MVDIHMFKWWTSTCLDVDIQLFRWLISTGKLDTARSVVEKASKRNKVVVSKYLLSAGNPEPEAQLQDGNVQADQPAKEDGQYSLRNVQLEKLNFSTC